MHALKIMIISGIKALRSNSNNIVHAVKTKTKTFLTPVDKILFLEATLKVYTKHHKGLFSCFLAKGSLSVCLSDPCLTLLDTRA